MAATPVYQRQYRADHATQVVAWREARKARPKLYVAEKACSRCHEVKPRTAFRLRPESRDGLRYECKACQNRTAVEYGRRVPAKRKQWIRTSVLKQKYGLTLVEYQRLVAAQGGRCLICAQSSSSLCVDHCHETGRVRGLLCTACNIALGNVRENKDVALALARYIDEQVTPFRAL